MKIIEDFRALPFKRQASIGMSLAIVCLLVALSVGAAVVQDAYLDATSGEQGGGQDAASGEAGRPDGDASGEGEGKGAAQGYDALDGTQKALADAYGDKEREFVGFLQASVWTADKEGKRLEFGEFSFTEIEGAATGSAAVPFAISALTQSSEEGSGAVVERTLAAMQTAASSKMIELQKVTDKDGNTTYSVTSEAFKAAKTYVRAEAASEFALEGVDGEFSTMIGGQQGELEGLLRELCATSYPTASKAVWDKRAVCDWDGGTVTFSVALNNDKKSQVGVVYSMEEKTFAIDAIK